MIFITKFKLFSLLLFPLALVINFLASKFPNIVDKYYSSFIDRYIVITLSKISGLFPFSLYEVTVYLIVFSIILFIINIIKTLISNKDYIFILLKKSLLNILSVVSIGYFLFIVLWGLNYNRTPLQETIISNFNNANNTNIVIEGHTTKELANLYKFLIDKVNESRNLLSEDKNGVMKANSNYKGVISRAQLGYDNIVDLLPVLSGDYAKPKYVLSSKLMCYTGITGIYFPFTGEANINIAVPDLYLPSTAIHEMAHQRGFASEDEANFIAYLGSINHPDIDFNYSGYILALVHTSNALYSADYDTYTKLSKNISDEVRRDLRNNRDFWKKYEGKVDEISNKFNDSYLKANGVKEGTASYGKMVDLLLTYYRLYSSLEE